MTRKSFANADCGVSQAVEQIGDKWSLVILRSAFLGLRRFDEFRRHLDIAPNILADRLGKLVEHGIFSSGKNCTDGRTIDYKLTAKGLDLYPMVIFLNQWSERWSPKPEGPRLEFRHRETGGEIKAVRVETLDGTQVDARQTEFEQGPGGSAVYEEAQKLITRRKLNSAH